jgi:hypothetical protein
MVDPATAPKTTYIFYIVHPSYRRAAAPAEASRTVSNVSVPPGVESLQGRARVDALRPVWAVSVDAVALGVVVMVVSSYIMWYQLKSKRRGGILALALGFLSCALFAGALRLVG